MNAGVIASPLQRLIETVHLELRIPHGDPPRFVEWIWRRCHGGSEGKESARCRLLDNHRCHLLGVNSNLQINCPVGEVIGVLHRDRPSDRRAHHRDHHRPQTRMTPIG